MDKTAIQTHVERLWDQSILPELTEYIRLPNKSPAFDPEWRAHGYMEQVVAVSPTGPGASRSRAWRSR